MKVQIQRYTKIENAGSLKGVAQILFEDIGLTINGVKIVESKNGGQFYAFPSEKYNDKETGEEKYREHAAFYIKGLYKEFNDVMNAAFKVYFQQNPPQANAQPSAPTQQFQSFPQPPVSHYNPQQAMPVDDLPF